MNRPATRPIALLRTLGHGLTPTLALAVIALLSGSCRPSAGPESAGGVQPRPEPVPTVRPAGAEAAARRQIEPRVRFDGPPGTLASGLVIDLGRPVLPEEKVGEILGGSSRWRLEPPEEARLVVRDASTLLLESEDGFAPDTTYRLLVEEIDTGRERLAPESGTGWSFELHTPAYALLSVEPVLLEPERRRITVDLVFTGPIDTGTIRDRVRFELDGPGGRTASPGRIRWGEAPNRHTARAVLGGVDLGPGRRVRALVSAGVCAPGGEPCTTGQGQGELDLDTGPQVTIRAVRVAESTNGFYLEVVCHDDAVAERRYYWDPVLQESFGQLSRRCLPVDGAVADWIRTDPPVDLTMAPSGGGFRLLGDLPFGDLELSIAPGLRTVDGGVLLARTTEELRIPRRSPRLRILAEGRYLPRSAWSTLPVRHLNVASAELVVRRVPPANLVYWMSDDDSEKATDRTSDLVLRQPVELSAPPDSESTTFLDVASQLPADTRGLLELTLSGDGATTTSRLLLTDLQIVAKRDADDGAFRVWVLDAHHLGGVGGAVVELVRRSGTVLASCRTSGSGSCRLEPHASDPDPAPGFALVARTSGDLSYLRLDDVRVEVQEERVAGEPYRGSAPYRAAVWTERGVYRPGETAHLAAIVRDSENVAPPAGLPVVLRLVDPRGRTAREHSLRTNPAGMVTVDLPFEPFATTGRWQARLAVADNAVGGTELQVEDFVPERMEVEVRPESSRLVVGDRLGVEIEARYLFGGVPAGHEAELTCDLEPLDFSAEGAPGFRFGPLPSDGAAARPVTLGTAAATLDDDGRATLPCPPVEDRHGLAGPATLAARAAVFEAGSGRTTVGRATAVIHPEPYAVGLATSTETAEAGEVVAVDGVVVDLDGRPTDVLSQVDLEVLRLEPEWGWYFDPDTGANTWRRWQRAVVADRLDVTVEAGRFHVAWTPPVEASAYRFVARAGRSRTELEVAGSGWWWWGGDSEGQQRTPRPARAAWLDLELPDNARVGDRVEVTATVPSRGRVLLSVETDTVLESEWLDVDAGELSWDFKVRRFVPNVYVTALWVKDPHAESDAAYAPDRGFGARSLRLEPEDYTQRVRLGVPAEVRSRATLTARLELGAADEPTWATVAVVDEGVLSVTRYASPDPSEAVFARRGLGVDTFETVGWSVLVPAAGGVPGGDQGGGPPPVLPVKPLALFSGLVQVPADGVLDLDFELPAYQGAVRVMAVTAGARRMGHAAARVVVRDPLVVQPTLPRFLLSGDEIEVPVAVTNLTERRRSVRVELALERLPLDGDIGGAAPVTVVSDPARTLDIAPGRLQTARFRVRAGGGLGGVRATVTARSDAIVISDGADIPLLPPRPRVRRVQKVELAAGRTDLAPLVRGWAPLTEHTTFWVTANPHADVFAHLKHLIRYPYGCIEQTTSTTRPLLFLGGLLAAVDPELVAEQPIEDMVRRGIARILSMQTPAGGFGYWPGDTEPSPWGTAYATHLLLDARDLRYPVPDERLEQVLRWIERTIDSLSATTRRDRHYSADAEPYLHYVLARAGRGRKGRIQRLIDSLDGDARFERREQLYLLEAALWLAGDRRFETELRHPDDSPLTDHRDLGWSFYSDRRMRGLMLSTFADLFGHDPAAERLAGVVADGLRTHPSGWYTTQELVWGVTGLGKYLAAAPAGFPPPRLLLDGREVEPAPAPPGRPSSDRAWEVARAGERRSLSLEVPATGDGPLWLVVTSEGVPAADAAWYRPPTGSGLQLERRVLDASGVAVDADRPVRLGDLLYVRLELANRAGRRLENVALVDRVPAGWEIENPRLGRGRAPDWMDDDGLWEPDHLDVRDDRLEVFGGLDAGAERSVVYAVRAVAAGRFTVPASSAEAMYDPRIRADGRPGEAVVTGPAAKGGR